MGYAQGRMTSDILDKHIGCWPSERVYGHTVVASSYYRIFEGHIATAVRIYVQVVRM
jgi:hypothetical protein